MARSGTAFEILEARSTDGSSSIWSEGDVIKFRELGATVRGR